MNSSNYSGELLQFTLSNDIVISIQKSLDEERKKALETLEQDIDSTKQDTGEVLDGVSSLVNYYYFDC